MTPARKLLAAPLLLLLMLVSLAIPAAAETPGERAAAEARRAAEDLRGALSQLDTALTADDQAVALARMISAYESGLATLREGLRHASLREAELRAGFAARQKDLSRMLAVMASSGRTPEAGLLLHPAGSAATARAGMVMDAVVPALRAEADRARADLEEIAAIRAAQQAAAETLSSGLARAQQARTLLSSAAADRSALPERFTADPEELARLQASAASLDEFAAGIARMEQDVGAPMADFEGAEGGLPLPVQGRVRRGYKVPDAAGVARPGLVLATAPRALVTAPWAATIRYRGPFLDYGNVMILEPARGYLLILAGMSEVFGQTGDVIAAGEPLGLMGGAEAAAPEFGVGFVVDAATGGDAGLTQTLYVELRKGAETLDPASWFVTDAVMTAPQGQSAADG